MKKECEKMEKTIQAFKEIKGVFNRHSIEIILGDGTLLGAIRENRIIPWDTGMDLLIWEKDLKKVEEALKELKNYEIRTDKKSQCPDINLMKGSSFIGFSIIRQEGDYLVNRWVVPRGFVGNTFDYVLWILKLYSADFKKGKAPYMLTKTLVRIFGRIPLKSHLISIFELLLENFDSYIIKQVFPLSYLKETKTINYYGEKVKVPKNSEEFLAFRYGNDWRVPKVVKKGVGYDEILSYDKSLSICSYEEFKNNKGA